MKRTLAAGLAALLAALILSGAAGSSADPLVSRSWAEGAWADSVTADAASRIDAGLAPALEEGRALLSTGEDFSLASGYVSLYLPAGASVRLLTGSSAVLTYGEATLSVASGTVIDVSDGSEKTGAVSLYQNRRYFCAEDTEATVTADTAGVLRLNGLYLAQGARPVLTAYDDVKPSDWFYPYAEYVRAHEVFHDWADTSFRPRDIADRATFVYAMWVTAGSPAPLTGADDFTDLTERWYMDAVGWATENGIILGDGNGHFMPDGSATREQIAVILQRYARYLGDSAEEQNDLSAYTDAALISPWAEEGMRWANAAGIITGTSSTTLTPQGTATRAEVAAIIDRVSQ